MLTISPTSFKSDYNQSMFNQKQNIPPCPMDYGDDSFELLTMDRQAQKKEKQQNRLNKMLAYSSVGIAVGLVGSLLLQIFAMVKAGKGEGSKNLKMVWEDFSKKDNFPALTDDCVNEKVR